jgi:hypothetical protein
MEHLGEVIGPAKWPALVDEGMWRAVVAILRDPARRTQWSSARRWLLSGLGVCGICERPTIYASLQASGRTSGSVPSYICGEVKHVVRHAAEVDRFVEDIVMARLSLPDAVDLMRVDDTVNTVDLHTQALTIRGQLNELAALYANRTIDAPQLAEGSTRLRAELDQVSVAIAEASRGSVLAGVVDADNVPAAWKALGLDRRRAIVDSLIEVTINRSTRGRPAGWRPGSSYFNPDSIDIRWKVPEGA